MHANDFLFTMIQSLVESSSLQTDVERVEKLPQSGGDRQYFRVYLKDGKTCIATFSEDLRESNTFLYFNRHFKSKGIPVPEVITVHDSGKCYLQQDLGGQSLLDVLEKEGYTESVYKLYEKSLYALAQLQIKGDEGLDYEQCLQSKSFGKQAMLNDLLYFRFYFLDTLGISYNKENLWNEMERLAEQLASAQNQYFMYRDFQSRNIMIQNDAVFFIDHQGGMKGPLMYDVASLLWQAKAQLPSEWKNNLWQAYVKHLNELMTNPISSTHLREQYEGMVWLRLLQVMGAYGFRGRVERKTHFLNSIPAGLKNIRQFLTETNFLTSFPLLKSLMEEISADKYIQTFSTPQATAETPLTVRISSFSFLKNGYPACAGKQGGGFVFDCRGILNPGRIEQYKTQSGLDQAVKIFLDRETRMPEFLKSVYETVDIAVEDYLARGFDALEIHFGCTGGQHRSVFAAESLNKHLQQKYNVRTVLQHLNQSNWLR
jgi:aminoglycoside/choline kinase family phosphotransferase